LEADLQRYYQVDLRDRWRFDEHGCRRLTLRRLGALVAGLPPESRVARAVGGDGLTTDHILLMDVFHASANKPHPARPSGTSGTHQGLERQQRLRAAKRRRAARQRAIAAGEIT
jgi:hypothetical protein